uniref:Uncharacterized protein n=1 Tax=Romanomermis culicivorax TaxID=13658 RepID=A0A915JDE0_ROMCU
MQQPYKLDCQKCQNYTRNQVIMPIQRQIQIMPDQCQRIAISDISGIENIDLAILCPYKHAKFLYRMEFDHQGVSCLSSIL